MKSDIDIATEFDLKPIEEIASDLNISNEALEFYGKYKAKINIDKLDGNKQGKLVLVSALNPTSAGEGKTTVNIGLGMALNKLGKQAISALREPSLGPVFGIKGGAAGGGYSQVVPMEDINLHFTGDFHAITSANNLISAVIDNHIFQGNELDFDIEKIIWKRCIDLNDRALRHVSVAIDGKKKGMRRDDGFDITVASEIMAIICLAKDFSDLRVRISEIVVGYTTNQAEITVSQLQITDAVLVLLKDAIKPNLVQTLEYTPAIIHGGPFANIAHGCNSLIATTTALQLSDYTVTEAGFGADLGAEKFLNIKCRYGDLTPSCVVLVATVKALKIHGGVAKEDLSFENVVAVIAGFANLKRHIANILQFNLNVVVAINAFDTDTEAEFSVIKDLCANEGVEAIITEVFTKGSKGALALANKVVELCNQPSDFKYLYDLNLSIEDKVLTIAKQIYGASGVVYTDKAKALLAQLANSKYAKFPVCMAKTQYSFSDDAKLLGAPTDFDITVKNIIVNAGARFVVIIVGSVMRMPGLSKAPAAYKITIDDNKNIDGLF